MACPGVLDKVGFSNALNGVLCDAKFKDESSDSDSESLSSGWPMVKSEEEILAIGEVSKLAKLFY